MSASSIYVMRDYKLMTGYGNGKNRATVNRKYLENFTLSSTAITSGIANKNTSYLL